jgi:nicotinate-nucleotide--dimethylbenzimidazole phosphoribosyltransferase
MRHAMPLLQLARVPWLLEHIERVGPLDRSAAARAQARLDRLTKPRGSLGRLERLAVQVAGIAGTERPRLDHKGIVVMAADHGVVAEGVSAYPAAVTAQMVRNFAAGHAAINVLARQARATVRIVDVGVAGTLPPDLAVVHRKVAFGSANMALGPALSFEEMVAAIRVGLDVVDPRMFSDLDVVCLGEMGIGNSTAAAAIVAALAQVPPSHVTGRGTGIDDATWHHKVDVVERALRINQPSASDALDVLRKVGGLDIAGLVGVAIGAAARRAVVVVDGFIATAAALIATDLCPPLRPYLVAAHRSTEVGHRAALERLELEPLLALDMRLGEGTGAALALPVLDAALALLNEMATFEEASVSGPAQPELIEGPRTQASQASRAP